MAVDLSRVGLEGLETSERLMTSMAARQAAAQELEINQFKLDTDRQEKEVEQRALAALADPGSVKSGTGIIDTDDDDSRGAVLERIGQLMIAGGAPQKGMDYLKAGVDIRDKESEISNREQTEQKTRLDNIISVSDLFSRTAGIAKNDSEWKYGLAQFRRYPEAVKIFGEENLAKLEQTGYSPDFVAYLNEQALSYKDRATLDLHMQTEERQQQSQRELSQYRRTVASIAEARATESERHNRVMEKLTGEKGSGLVAPTGDQIKTAEAAVANLVFKGIVPGGGEDENATSYAAFKSGAQDIASRAMQMVRENRGMNYSSAVNRATMESLAAGDWEAFKKDPEDDTFAGTRFKGRGGSPMDAVPLPPNKGRLKTGAYYITSRGVAKWNGREFVKESETD